MKKYSVAGLEDIASWQDTEEYVKIASNTTVSICTEKDIYLKQNFEPNMATGSISEIHTAYLRVMQFNCWGIKR